MAINKSLQIGVKRAHKQGDWLGVDGTYTFTTSNLQEFGDSAKLFEKEIMAKVKTLNTTEGFKINETLDDNALKDQLTFITNYAKDEEKKAKNTRSGSNWDKPTQRNAYKEQLQMATALYIIANAIQKELKDRQNVDNLIASAQQTDTLESWNGLKNSWRSLYQKKLIEDSIARVNKAIKDAQELAKAEAEKQAKLDELNKKLATSTDAAEKQAIASQISALMGNVSTQTGLPKGALYIGVGVAVMLGIWITIRAIRK